MLTYVGLSITAYLVLQILRAPRKADATGYLLVSGLMPLPVYMIGRSAEAGVFPIDVCLFTYLVTHGLPTRGHGTGSRALSAGLAALLGLSVVATCSGVFNYLYLDADALRYYAFTVVKFWEYTLLGIVLLADKPDAAQLRKICVIVVAGLLIYEILHVMHLSGIVPLSGEVYFGPRVKYLPPEGTPFSDRTQWFLATPRAVVGGTASIGLWFSLLVFETYPGTIRRLAAATAVLAVFSVFATSSRSDIAGLVVGAFVFGVYGPPRRWKTYACSALAAAALYAGYLTYALPGEEHATAINRMIELWNPELRAAGDYGYRSSDRAALLSYLPAHPKLLLIGVGPGNFHWYQNAGITTNFYGHNSYLHWTGELGIGGLLLLLAWCFSVCLYVKKRLRSQPAIRQLAARTCLALVVGRMVAGWGAESLFGTQTMGQYSLFFVGVVYLLASIASGESTIRFRLLVQRNRFAIVQTAVGGRTSRCPS